MLRGAIVTPQMLVLLTTRAYTQIKGSSTCELNNYFTFVLHISLLQAILLNMTFLLYTILVFPGETKIIYMLNVLNAVLS